MPYVEKGRRQKVIINGPENAGDLNYALTLIVRSYLKSQGLSYQTCNDIVGALDNAKDEFRRRIQHKYEDAKIQANGDVY